MASGTRRSSLLTVWVADPFRIRTNDITGTSVVTAMVPPSAPVAGAAVMAGREAADALRPKARNMERRREKE